MTDTLLRQRKFAADPTDPWLPQLQQLETELHHPGTRCSRERLEALLHLDFHEVGRSGRPYDRDTVIDVLVRQTQAPQVVSDGFRVQRLADDLALLTYRSAHVEFAPPGDGALPDGGGAPAGGSIGWAGATREEPRPVQVRHALRSSLWCRGPDGWQMLYHQGTAVEAMP